MHGNGSRQCNGTKLNTGAELQARARRHWFHLTQEDVEQITGTREQLIERVQERYGFSREQAVKEVDAWAFFLRSDL